MCTKRWDQNLLNLESNQLQPVETSVCRSRCQLCSSMDHHHHSLVFIGCHTHWFFFLVGLGPTRSNKKKLFNSGAYRYKLVSVCVCVSLKYRRNRGEFLIPVSEYFLFYLSLSHLLYSIRNDFFCTTHIIEFALK